MSTKSVGHLEHPTPSGTVTGSGAVDANPAEPSQAYQAMLVACALLLPVGAVFWLLATAVVGAEPVAGAGGLDFLPDAQLLPEPGEQRAYLLLLMAPLTLAAAVLAALRWGTRLRAARPSVLVPAAAASQVVFLCLLFASMRVQQRVIYGYFDDRQLWICVGAGAAVAAVVLLGPHLPGRRADTGGGRRPRVVGASGRLHLRLLGRAFLAGAAVLATVGL